ncbi:MAG: imelysin family protein [Kangiellaceae bacterium]|nr:imelysin family protein [Kangiellaceae bacterium]
MKSVSLISPIAISISIALFGTGCSDSSNSTAGSQFNDNSGNGGTPTQFNEESLVAHLTNNVFTPTYQDFNSLAITLQQAVNQYCTSERGFASGSNSEQQRDEHKLAAQNQWKETMGKWQTIEIMQIGPLVENQGALRNRIYSWPVTNSCAVDQDVVFFNQGEINGNPYDINDRVVTRKGLDAAEYLLFNTDLNHSCTASTAPAGWDNLTDAQRREQRCLFAVEVSSDIVNNSQLLLDDWTGSNGYAQSLLNAANQPGPDFDNVHEAVNRISDGLFYIDSVTKDAKLAIPLGLFANDCQQNACPENVESLYASESIEHIRNNLLSLQMIFNGEIASHNDTVGFDDFLNEVGAQAAATNINNSINNALSNLDAYQETLGQALANNPNQVQLTHEQIKAITDQMKTDFINQLALTLPASSAGDND